MGRYRNVELAAARAERDRIAKAAQTVYEVAVVGFTPGMGGDWSVGWPYNDPKNIITGARLPELLLFAAEKIEAGR